MTISQYDISNIDSIISGEGNWFTAKLLRLMAHADMDNLKRLAYVFPEEFVAFAKWKWNGIPAVFVTVDSVRNLVTYEQTYATAAKDIPHWIDATGKAIGTSIKHGRDF